MTSAARDLMDTGTAAPWRLSRVHGRAVLIRDCRDDVLLADATLVADARKIVLSVNALPLVDALIEAIDALPTYVMPTDHDPACVGLGCAHPTVVLHHRLVTARDALEAALRGEGDG